MLKVFARERLFTCLSKLDESTVQKIVDKYTFRFFDEKSCSQCEWAEIRRAQGMLGECEACASYMGSVFLANRVKIKDRRYLATPIGDFKGLCSLLPERPKLIEKHKIWPIKPIKFVGEPRAYQVKAVKACIAGEKGVLYSPPRSGKTVMLSKMICDLSVKSLIIASQRDWLMGFYETFVGSDTQKPMTDIDKSRIGFCKSYKDFLKYDVCLATVQTFHSEAGQKLLKKLRDVFTFVGIDEVHTSSANKYLQEISRFNCKYKIGLTGTPDRKDGRYPLTEAVVGPVLHKVEVERLRPQVRLVRTGFSEGSSSSIWAYIVRKLESNEERLKLIAQYAVKDAESGHIVLIPLAQTKPIARLVELINEKAGSRIAYSFTGSLRKDVRDQLIQDARQRKVKVLVGTMKILSTGINIPSASCLYMATLSSNIPQCEQRVSRILTPYEGKPQPVLRIFLDDTNVSRSCLSNEWWRCIRPVFKPIISPKDEEALKSFLKRRSGWL